MYLEFSHRLSALRPSSWIAHTPNRIKECQADLFAGRTSTASMRANQLRLWFAAFAYVAMTALRCIGLAGTELVRATCGTIRLKLLKIGALITTSVRRVKIALASSCPQQATFAIAYHRLRSIVLEARLRHDAA
jgi:Transposase DDE domain group 1